MKRAAAFAAACLTIIGATLLVLWFVYDRPGDRRAVVVSAAVGFAVQMMAFGGARTVMRQDVMVGWGAGVLLRFLALAVYALVAVPRLGLPLSAALVSLALYLFLSTLIEPLFLKP